MRRCECRILPSIKSKLPARYQNARLVDFSEITVAKVNHWLKAPTDGLLLAGKTGTGKTHLAAAIVRHRVEQGKPIKFARAADIYQAIRETYSRKNGDEGPTEEAVLSDYAEAAMLVIDDLGSGSLSDHERRYTLELLDQRLNHLRPTIVTSNWSLREISDRMDERIASRLSSFTTLEFQGQDRRQRKAGQK